MSIIGSFTAYVKQTWLNRPNKTTPISAYRLSHMEDGIEANSKAVVALDTELTKQKSEFTEHKEHGVNNNILINSNFANPVNQRGATAESWTSGQHYGFDRWRLYNATVLSISPLLKFKPKNGMGGIYQYIDEPLRDSYAVVSACVNGKVLSFKTKNKATAKVQEKETVDGVELYFDTSYYDTNGFLVVCVYGTDTTKEYTVEWVKCEFGDHATPYVPRLYAEELELCKRYYQLVNEQSVIVYKYSDTFVMHCIDYEEMRTEPTPIIKESITYDSDGNFQIATEVTADITFKTFGRFKSTYPRAIRDNSYAVIFTVGLDAEL